MVRSGVKGGVESDGFIWLLLPRQTTGRGIERYRISVQDECQKPHRAVHVVEVQVEGVCEEGLASGSWARDGLVGWPGRVGLGQGA